MNPSQRMVQVTDCRIRANGDRQKQGLGSHVGDGYNSTRLPRYIQDGEEIQCVFAMIGLVSYLNHFHEQEKLKKLIIEVSISGGKTFRERIKKKDFKIIADTFLD